MPKPYRLIAVFQTGYDVLIEEGDDPVSVRAAHTKVSRNRKAVSRIELHDPSGCLETIWQFNWPDPK